MNAPAPLTATPPARLDWRAHDQPVARDFEDIYYSTDGGLEECREVFLRACQLPDAWRGKDVFVIGELGFGTGLNFLATLKLWQETARAGQRLVYISVEGFPLDKDQLIRALSGFGEVQARAKALIRQWPGRVKGTHVLEFGTLSLHLVHEQVEPALISLDARINAWFLDGFSPAKNPDMWSDDVFAHLARLSAPGARVGTFTVAGQVRRGLAAAGFEVSKRKGFGRKRERLEAVWPGTSGPTRTPLARPLIIGGGIAGASLARAFARRGIPPVLLDPDPDLARAASGNPAGLIMPKPDLQDRPESRFYHQAYLYGRRVYEPTGQVFGKGVIQIARTRAEQTRFEKLVINQALPPDELSLLTHSQAEERIGRKLAGGFGALFAAGALQISPKAIAQALRDEADHVPGRATSLAQAGELWQVSLEDGTALEADHVFVCAGAEVPDLLNLDVRFTRGQLIWGRAARRPELAMMCGEYVLPFDGQLLIGATHEQTGPGQDTRIDPARTQALQRAAQAMFETDLDFTPTQARTSVRVTTRNTLPIAAQIKPGLSVLTGLGSRGFLLAPLLGEYLAAKALSEPSPVDIRTQKRFAGQFVP